MNRAQAFKAKNEQTPVVAAEWLDANGKQVTEGPETWVKYRARFADGTQMTISEDDLVALHDSEFAIRWDYANAHQGA